MIVQVWHDQPAFHVRGIEVSSIGFWLTSDSAKPLPHSFALQVTARVLGVAVGSATLDPMQNGSMTMPLLAGTAGTVEGKVCDWCAFDKDGKPVSSSDTAWKSAASVAFMMTGVADVTLDATALAGVIPGLSFLAKAALAILGNKVKVSIAHEHVVAQLPHGSETLAVAPTPGSANGANVA